MCNMCHMKTISLRELHNNTGKWVRSVREGDEVAVTDRGVQIAVIRPIQKEKLKKSPWADRPLLPGYAKYLREGKVGPDSTPGISAERDSRENSILGSEE
jgi:prevent-host-death family protein